MPRRSVALPSHQPGMTIAPTRPHMRTALLAILTTPGIPGQAAAACTSFTVNSADQICPAAATSCVIKQAFCIASGATLDFGTRGLEFEIGGQFSVQPGGVITISAG